MRLTHMAGGLLLALAVPTGAADLTALRTPVVLAGDATTAYRDPAVYFHDGTFYLYYTYCSGSSNSPFYWQTAWSKSRDLVNWTPPQCFTPRDLTKNFSSPGCIVRDGADFVLCLQTYPTPRPGDMYGDASSRIWTLRSRDLEHWGPPRLLRVQGPAVAPEKMGRIIDGFLLRDKDDAARWWCFYKLKGRIHASTSPDLETWTPTGQGPDGENPCVIVDGRDYVLFHSPANGIGVSRSADLKTWRPCGTLTLGQRDWPWAQGRLTAGCVLDLRREPGVGKALMFFHGSRYPEKDPRGGWGTFVSIGLAWSDDLEHWSWPGQNVTQHP